MARVFAQNKKALFDYEILDRLEAGIVLTGDEVKAIRAGQASLIGSFATVYQGELFLLNCAVQPYRAAYEKNEKEVSRSRKLLVSKKERSRLVGQLATRGIVLIPLKLYANERNLIKVELGLAKHRKVAGKKELLKERDIRRETQRELKGRTR